MDEVVHKLMEKEKISEGQAKLEIFFTLLDGVLIRKDVVENELWVQFKEHYLSKLTAKKMRTIRKLCKHASTDSANGLPVNFSDPHSIHHALSIFVDKNLNSALTAWNNVVDFQISPEQANDIKDKCLRLLEIQFLVSDTLFNIKKFLKLGTAAGAVFGLLLDFGSTIITSDRFKSNWMAGSALVVAGTALGTLIGCALYPLYKSKMEAKKEVLKEKVSEEKSHADDNHLLAKTTNDPLPKLHGFFSGALKPTAVPIGVCVDDGCVSDEEHQTHASVDRSNDRAALLV